MVSSGRVKLSKVRKMLEKCAPGYTQERKTHHRIFTWNGVVAILPRGEHGKKDPEIEFGHLKRMIRFLDIDTECVRKNLRQVASFLKK